MKRLVHWLNRGVHFQSQWKEAFVASFLVALTIVIFLVVFRPFGIFVGPSRSFSFMFGYGVIVFMGVLGLFYYVSFLMHDFSEEKWKTKHLLLNIFIQMMVSAIFCWVYTITFGSDHIVNITLPQFIGLAFATGFFPAMLYIIYVDRTAFRRSLQEQLKQQTTPDQDLVATSVEKEKPLEQEIALGDETMGVKLYPSQLICISSEGNYIKVHMKKGDEISFELLRHTISNAENQLSGCDRVKRCHRSYLVNFDYVRNVSGNAKERVLHIPGLKFTIPVSRNFDCDGLMRH